MTNEKGNDARAAEYRSLNQLLGNRYELERLIGRGGFSAVYLGRDRQLQIPVAIKVLSQGGASTDVTMERFLREGRAMRHVRSPRVVSVHDLVRGDDFGAIVMEYADGGNLATILEAADLTVLQKINLALEIAFGLRDIHATGIIHRDLKPSNVLVSTAGSGIEVKIADFGTATAGDDFSIHDTQAGLAGTPLYMSPERFTSATPITPAADVYSLGVIILEMLTGHPPFEAADAFDVAMGQTRRSIPTLIEGPEDLNSLIRSMLSWEPSDRPEIDSVIASLERIADEVNPHDRTYSSLEKSDVDDFTLIRVPSGGVDKIPTVRLRRFWFDLTGMEVGRRRQNLLQWVIGISSSLAVVAAAAAGSAGRSFPPLQIVSLVVGILVGIALAVALTFRIFTVTTERRRTANNAHLDNRQRIILKMQAAYYDAVRQSGLRNG